MKKIYKKVVILAALAIIAGYNVYMSNDSTYNLTNITLNDIEALAGCEVRSDDALNKGVCASDVSGTTDYCVTPASIWDTRPKCSTTI